MTKHLLAIRSALFFLCAAVLAGLVLGWLSDLIMGLY